MHESTAERKPANLPVFNFLQDTGVRV